MCNLFHMSPARVKEGETRLNKTLAYFAALCYIISCAGVVKLADALDSKSCGSDTVWVRFPPSAPKWKPLVRQRKRWYARGFVMSALYESGLSVNYVLFLQIDSHRQ